MLSGVAQDPTTIMRRWDMEQMQHRLVELDPRDSVRSLVAGIDLNLAQAKDNLARRLTSESSHPAGLCRATRMWVPTLVVGLLTHAQIQMEVDQGSMTAGVCSISCISRSSSRHLSPGPCCSEVS